jgi:hypothetical protein
MSARPPESKTAVALKSNPWIGVVALPNSEILSAPTASGAFWAATGASWPLRVTSAPVINTVASRFSGIGPSQLW